MRLTIMVPKTIELTAEQFAELEARARERLLIPPGEDVPTEAIFQEAEAENAG